MTGFELFGPGPSAGVGLPRFPEKTGETRNARLGAWTSAAAGILLLAASPIQAADYPTKPIRLLVGFAPGGGTDTTARIMAEKMSKLLGQQIIVDNRPGAGGNIAAAITARANPDGYTILLATMAGLAINPSLYDNLPFDTQKDFAPVMRAVDSTNVLVVHASVPTNSVKDLIALAKSKPGILNQSSSGVGSVGHLAGELFNTMAGIKIVHVAYKGGGPAALALLSGEVDLMFASGPSIMSHIRGGRVKALAVTNSERSLLMPGLPTIAEAGGLPGFEVNQWYGFVVAAKTPRPIINRLNKDITAVLNMPDVKETLFMEGLTAAPSTPEQFGGLIKSEGSKWAKVVKQVGAKAN